jgi:hypothetical protein
VTFNGIVGVINVERALGAVIHTEEEGVRAFLEVA